MRIIAVLAVVASAVFAGGASPAGGSASALVTFSTPSHNIACDVYAFSGELPGIRCDIASGLKPKPTRPASCTLDYGSTVEMRSNGRSSFGCAGGIGAPWNSPILAYGKRLSFHGIVCTSRFDGLRCGNQRGHGFFLSRQHSYLF